MTAVEAEFSQRIISGINYLALEAQNHGAIEIASILRVCMKDICISIENDLSKETVAHQLLNSDLFYAIQFLSKCALLDDEDLKRDILQTLEKVEKELN